MKLAEVHFDWCPSIPGADSRGEGLLFPLTTQSIFRAAEGWSLEKTEHGIRLHREGMPNPVTVVGDGYTFVEAPPVPAEGAGGGTGVISEAALSNTELSGAKLLAAAERQRKAKK